MEMKIGIQMEMKMGNIIQDNDSNGLVSFEEKIKIK